MSEKRYDVTVIGAGIGGLTGAAILAKAGLRVCIVEQASQVGGYLASFDRGGFRFDSSIHWLNQCGPEGMVRNVFDFIDPDVPETLPQKHIRRMKGETFDYLLTDNPDDLKSQLIRDFPHETKGIEKFFKAARSLGVAFSKSAHLGRTTQSMALMEKSIHGIRALPTLMAFLKYLPYSAEKGLKKFFKNEALRAVFCAEESLMSCLVPIGWSYSGDYHHAPKTGSCAFPKWLCRILESAGADILLNHEVKKIRLQENRIRGITVKHGSGTFDIHSDIVIAACDVETLYRRLLPPGIMDPAFLEKLDHAEIYQSSFTIYIGLDCLPDTLGMGTEAVFLTRDGIPRKDHNNSDPHLSAISVLSPSLRDPSLAPDGKGTLIIFVQATFDYADTWHTESSTTGAIIRSDAYRKFKKQYADILIQRVEDALLPGLRDHIELCDIATPVTFQRYTGNREGSMMGARPGKKNMKAGIAHYKTAVENLYLSGHWAEYGGGVPIAVKTALNTALLILKKRNSRLYAILRDLADGKITSCDARGLWERKKTMVN